ncbi:hypothetical protein AC1031_011423 [Aphanomyces cochlioides]|nr:hypothetical protein AC1031_011423 [Aphanomyces cochlioides]
MKNQEFRQYVESFLQLLLDPRVTRLCVYACGIIQSPAFLDMLVPLLQQSYLEEMDLYGNSMSETKVIRLAEGIRPLKTLKRVVLLDNNCGYLGAKAFIDAAPASVRKILVEKSESGLLKQRLSSEEVKELVQLAEEKSIQLFGER